MQLPTWRYAMVLAGLAQQLSHHVVVLHHAAA